MNKLVKSFWGLLREDYGPQSPYGFITIAVADTRDEIIKLKKEYQAKDNQNIYKIYNDSYNIDNPNYIKSLDFIDYRKYENC